MDYNIRPVKDSDQDELISIFNYYIENSYAAFFEKKMDVVFITRLRQAAAGYPFFVAETPEGKVAGFGLLHRYHPAGAFNRTAEITYFLEEQHTHHGLGTRLLEKLIENARTMGIETLLAGISSLNKASLDFHKKNGFTECGCFVRAGRKFGQDFDLVWMQKFLGGKTA
jgi:L-amino acid N-acyltransferase YncA